MFYTRNEPRFSFIRRGALGGDYDGVVGIVDELLTSRDIMCQMHNSPVYVAVQGLVLTSLPSRVVASNE